MSVSLLLCVYVYVYAIDYNHSSCWCFTGCCCCVFYVYICSYGVAVLWFAIHEPTMFIFHKYIHIDICLFSLLSFCFPTSFLIICWFCPIHFISFLRLSIIYIWSLSLRHSIFPFNRTAQYTNVCMISIHSLFHSAQGTKRRRTKKVNPIQICSVLTQSPRNIISSTTTTNETKKKWNKRNASEINEQIHKQT